MRWTSWLVLMPLVGLVSGCGGDYGPQAKIEEKTVPVSGILTYKGQPLENYLVSFLPPEGHRVASGLTDAAGKFTMGTNAPGDGAPPGPCKVSVAFAGPPPEDASSQQGPIDDPALLPKPKIQIPDKYGNPDTSGLTQDVPENGITDLKIDLQ